MMPIKCMLVVIFCPILTFVLTFVLFLVVRLDTHHWEPGFQVGRVQIYQSGQWGGVCGTGWDDRDARVTCRELGFPYSKVRAPPVKGRFTPSGHDCVCKYFLYICM